MKTFRFDRATSSALRQVTRNGAPVRALVAWPAGLGDMEEFLAAFGDAQPLFSCPPSYFVLVDRRQAETRGCEKVSGNNTFDQPYQYAAVTDLYFAAAFLPDVPGAHHRGHAAQLHRSAQRPQRSQQPEETCDVLGIAVGDTAATPVCASSPAPRRPTCSSPSTPSGADGKPDGPSLGAADPVRLVDHHRQAALLALRCCTTCWDRDNWGWAIIVFTVIFNLVLLPTRIMDDEVVAQDDAHSAQGRRHQEALRESQGERPQARGDEHRDDGALQGQKA